MHLLVWVMTWVPRDACASGPSSPEDARVLWKAVKRQEEGWGGRGECGLDSIRVWGVGWVDGTVDKNIQDHSIWEGRTSTRSWKPIDRRSWYLF